MDVFSHGLWAGVAGRAVNLKKEKPLKIKWVMFWGVFPDVFAFGFSFVWMFASFVFPFVPKIEHLRPDQMEPVTQNGRFIFHLTYSLYNLSHSLIIFLAVFGLIWLIRRQPVWIMGGWGLHILMDIPTHSYQFFPTPFLWPVSNFMVNGTHWGTLRFETINYSLIILAYLALFLWRKKQKT